MTPKRINELRRLTANDSGSLIAADQDVIELIDEVERLEKELADIKEMFREGSKGNTIAQWRLNVIANGGEFASMNDLKNI